ncbi:MAG: hypothetical protein AAGD13_01685 [Pseudomonadota bacterium]
MPFEAPEQQFDTTTVINTEPDVSSGDAMRARMSFLAAQNSAILTQTQFADAKAGALMTILGLIAIKGSAPVLIMIQDPLEMLSMAIIIVSIFFCLSTIMPRIVGFTDDAVPPIGNRFTWLFLTMPGYTDDMHGAYARETRFGDLLNSIAASNMGASRILARKFLMLRWAFMTGFAGSALLLFASNT